MTATKEDLKDLTDIILPNSTNVNEQIESETKRKPKRVLHFSDGVLEEYSSEDEVDSTMKTKELIEVDPKTLDWLPWTWYLTTWAGSKVLNGCDYVGEYLANFFGITSPKYQFEIDEFRRLQALERETARQEDLEMGGWNDKKRNNLINSSEIPGVENKNAIAL